MIFAADSGIKFLRETSMNNQEYFKDGFIISTDPTQLQIDEVFAFLSQSYWAKNRSKECVALSLRHSLCFGLYHKGRQIGLARVVTDYSTFAHLCDVYVLEEYRHRNLGKWLIAIVLNHPDLQGIRLWSLLTRDAHGLYRSFGFTELRFPERWLEKLDPSK